MSKLSIAALLVLIFAVPQSLAAQTLELYSDPSFVDINDSAAIPIYARLVSSDSTATFALGALDFQFLISDFSCDHASIDSITTAPATQHFLLEESRSGCYRAPVAMTASNPVTLTNVPTQVASLHLTYVSTEQTSGIYTSINAFSDSLEPASVGSSSFALDIGCYKGDVLQGDGTNSGDALKALYGAIGSLELTPREMCAADVNDDNVLEVGDVILVLQLAVGIPLPKQAPMSAPAVRLQASHGTSMAVLTLAGMAGSQLTLEYDPSALRYASLTQETSGALVAAHEPSPGRVILGLADTSNGNHEIRLQFELLADEADVNLESVKTYNSDGERIEATVESAVAALGGSTTDAPRSRVQGLAFVGATPNPFNPRTTLRFLAPSTDPIRVRVLNAAGRLVFEDTVMPDASGSASLVWNGDDVTGRPVGSGVYHVEARQQTFLSTGSTVLVR